MAYEIQGFDLGTLVANADLSAKQYCFMKVVNAANVGKIDACAAAGEDGIGILQEKGVIAGDAARVRTSGVSLVKSGAAFNPGDKLKSDAQGRAIAAAGSTVNTSDAGAAADPVVGSHVLATALEIATGADQFVACLVHRIGAVPTTAA